MGMATHESTGVADGVVKVTRNPDRSERIEIGRPRYVKVIVLAEAEATAYLAQKLALLSPEERQTVVKALS